jgi:hypothetical protein
MDGWREGGKAVEEVRRAESWSCSMYARRGSRHMSSSFPLMWFLDTLSHLSLPTVPCSLPPSLPPTSPSARISKNKPPPRAQTSLYANWNTSWRRARCLRTF